MYNTSYDVSGAVASFMHKVYGWMGAGLAITASTAYLLYSVPGLMMAFLGTPFIPFLLFMAQLACVIALSSFVMRMSLTTAVGVFIGYSMLTGITLSSIFVVYETASIALAFGVAAGMFAVMGLYGYYTNDDLTGMGSYLRMGLIGLIIASLVNFFLGSAQMDYIISLFGVGIFTLLTAYDTQKIKEIGYNLLGHDNDTIGKAALIGALSLYLDFINLFLYLLRLFGSRRR